jgi:hypothetical protein
MVKKMKNNNLQQQKRKKGKRKFPNFSLKNINGLSLIGDQRICLNCLMGAKDLIQ